MTRSRPADRSSPQLVPNGPRTPIRDPVSAAHSAALTAPTDRMVWVMLPSVIDGSPLTEIAISPTPKAYSIMNSPGAGDGSAVSIGSRHNVTESTFSATVVRTR